jgi:hypothetical protein
MAKIEVWTRNVENTAEIPFFGYPQHLFLLYTDGNGKQQILRGGPEDDNPFGKAELRIVKQNYAKDRGDNDSKVYDYYDSKDSENTLNYQGAVIIEANDENTPKSIEEKWQKMWVRAQEINDEKYDYEFLTQNSNTAVVQMAKAVELDDEVRDFVDEKSLFAPADKAELEHSLVDRSYDIYEALSDGIKRSKGTIEDFKIALQELGLNPYAWLYLIAKMLRRPIEELLKDKVKELLKKLLGSVDPLKPVIVLKESKTGRNELFVDQLTGSLMDREEFASLIESGQYSGYTVASIDGLATPMSKPDKVTANNLG